MGVKGGISILTSQNPSLALFVNIQENVYWSGTVYARPKLNLAWLLDVKYGDQDANPQGLGYYAWAVHDGDVAATPVPEANSALNLLCGFAFLGWLAYHRRVPPPTRWRPSRRGFALPPRRPRFCR
jgi:hypothetical protein